MTRILVLEPAGNLWGSERALLDFLEAASGDPDLSFGISCPPNSPFIREAAKLKVEIFPTFIANLHKRRTWSRVCAAINFARCVAAFRPDVVYVNQAGATRLALIATRLWRVPVVAHVRLAEDVRPIRRLLLRGHLAGVVCVSDFIRNLFGECRGSEKITMIYDPYRFAETSSAPVKHDGASASIACVGRIARGKGQDVLIHAVARLNNIGVRAKAVFYGVPDVDPSYFHDLKTLIGQLGVASLVEFRGNVPDVRCQLATNDVLVSTSYRESLGRVVFEAWDVGIVPVVWAGSGGTAESVSRSGGGVLYERQDGPSLAETLCKTLAMPYDDKSVLVAAGRAWLRENCHPRTSVERTLTVLKCASQARTADQNRTSGVPSGQITP